MCHSFKCWEVRLAQLTCICLLSFRLMEERPGEAVAWYAAGCYYMACGQVCANCRYIERHPTSGSGVSLT